MVIATIGFVLGSQVQLFLILSSKRPTSSAGERCLRAQEKLISRVSVFKLISSLIGLTDLGHTRRNKTVLPNYSRRRIKGANVAVDIGGDEEGNTRPAGQAGQEGSRLVNAPRQSVLTLRVREITDSGVSATYADPFTVLRAYHLPRSGVRGNRQSRRPQTYRHVGVPSKFTRGYFRFDQTVPLSSWRCLPPEYAGQCRGIRRPGRWPAG